MSNKNKQGQGAQAQGGQPVQKKPRGSPKGVKKGPRKIFFACAAMDAKNPTQLLQEELIFDSPEKATAENATKMFETKHGVAPRFVSGPYYEVKRAHAGGVERQTDTLSIPLKDLILDSSRRFEGEFKGWKIVGTAIRGRDDVLFPIYGDPVDPENKKRRPAQGNEVVRISSVKNMRPIKDDEDSVP